MNVLPMRVIFKITSAALALVLPALVIATPITYEFYLVTSGSLGGWSFDNALVHFRTQSDTSKAVFYLSLGNPPNQQFNIWLNTYGTTTVTVMSQGKTAKAQITDPLFVSIDQTGGGVGLGSYDSAGNFDPTYPVGIQDGLPDCIGPGDGDCVNPNAETLSLLYPDLVSSITLSGRAWSDSCFLGAQGCDGPALNTSAGAFLLKRPYYGFGSDPFVTGIFRATIQVHSHE
jgi:hypothetical protein